MYCNSPCLRISSACIDFQVGRRKHCIVHQQQHNFIVFTLRFGDLNGCSIIRISDYMQYLHIQKGITISEPVIVLTISSRPVTFTFASKFLISRISMDGLSASRVQFSIDSASNSFFGGAILASSGLTGVAVYTPSSMKITVTLSSRSVRPTLILRASAFLRVLNGRFLTMTVIFFIIHPNDMNL